MLFKDFLCQWWLKNQAMSTESIFKTKSGLQLTLITCAEIKQVAYHLRSKIRLLKLAFFGSEQHIALSLPQ